MVSRVKTLDSITTEGVTGDSIVLDGGGNVGLVVQADSQPQDLALWLEGAVGDVWSVIRLPPASPNDSGRPVRISETGLVLDESGYYHGSVSTDVPFSEVRGYVESFSEDATLDAWIVTDDLKSDSPRS